MRRHPHQQARKIRSMPHTETIAEGFPPDLFEGGPPNGVQRLLHLARRRGPDVIRRSIAMFVLGWAVPFLLVVVRSALGEVEPILSFLSDFAVHSRSFVAAPALVFAETICGPRLTVIACHFVDSGLVPPSERPRFEAAVRSTVRLRDAPVAEFMVAFLAYGIVYLVIKSGAKLPDWQINATGTAGPLSLAGWWHSLVSVPLLLFLILGWFWRVGLWMRFLWLVSRIELRLIPAHPDQAGGLQFVGHSLRAFGIVGFGFGTVVAGTLANKVAQGASPLVCKNAAIALAAFVVTLFGSPLLVFMRNLVSAWRKGILRYGGLADRLGREFEGKWLDETDPGPTLEVPDFSAAVDLYSVVGNAYQMRFVPIDYGSLVLLVIATLSPFVPVLILALPFEVIVDGLANLLF
jgi:hypothetical protein